MHVATQPSHGGSLEDSAYRCYRKRSGEEALLERKQKQRRIGASLDFFCKRDTREMNKPHYQYLLKLHQQLMPTINPLCASNGCENQCLPFANRCSRRILNCTMCSVARCLLLLPYVSIRRVGVSRCNVTSIQWDWAITFGISIP